MTPAGRNIVTGIEDVGVAIENQDLIRVLILSRYASVRIGLRAMLEGREPIQVIGEVGGAHDIESFPLAPDVVLCEVEEEASDAILRSIAELECGIVVLGLGAEAVPCLIQMPFQGWALIPRESSADEIVAAVQAVAEGLVVLGACATAAFPVSFAEPALLGETVLTSRELEILQLMAEGLPNKQIALGLGISLHTAKFHVAAILAKLGVASRTEAVTNGVRQGLLHL